MGRAAHIIFFLLPILISAQQVPCLYPEMLKTEDSTGVKLIRLKCNSNESDYSPYILNKRLYFVSGRNTKPGVEYKDVEGNSGLTNIFSAVTRSHVTSAAAVMLPGAVNTKFNEGPFCFSNNGKRMYYTGNSKRSLHPQLFYSDLENGIWKNPRCLEFCSDSFSYCHPALNAANDTLVFSSNMRGGHGGMDLYYTVFKDSAWQAPVNLGTSINSEHNEVFPFISPASELFFSSNRPGGTGALDLYKAKKEAGAYFVRPLSAPFNSAEDDFGIYIDSTLNSGYFSTSRQPKYKDDLYRFERSVPDFSEALKFPVKKSFCFTFFEERAVQARDTIHTEFEWDFGDMRRDTGISCRHCYDRPGSFDVKLKIIQKVEGEVFETVTNYPMTIDTIAAIRIFSPDTIVAMGCAEFRYHVEGFRGYKIEKAYWSFGDGFYNSGQQVPHVFRKPASYLVTVLLVLKDLADESTKLYKTEKKVLVTAGMQ